MLKTKEAETEDRSECSSKARIKTTPSMGEHVTVKDSAGKEIESQILPLLNESLSIRNNLVKECLGISPSVTSSYWLAFSATVPPLDRLALALTVSQVPNTQATLQLQLLLQRDLNCTRQNQVKTMKSKLGQGT
ncbi:hypothetical protein ACLB2K_048421 [Fragaria x ananassa]